MNANRQVVKFSVREIRKKQNKEINNALKSRFPQLTDNEIAEVNYRIHSYIASGLRDGWSIALYKQNNGKVEVKALELGVSEDEI